MLKEIVIAIDSYFRAHRFIRAHRLWKWILIPGILYCLLFVTGMYFFIRSADAAVSYLSASLGIDRWLHQQGSGFLSFLFLMGGIMVRIILVFFYFSLFKYLFLIIGSPLFACLSEKTESIMNGKDFPFSFRQLEVLVTLGLLLQVCLALVVLIQHRAPQLLQSLRALSLY